MLRTLRSLLRFQRIVRTLARHDALAPMEETGIAPGLVWIARRFSRRAAKGRPGQKLARALAEMGPSFIKLGQMLSTRADLVGEQVAQDLAELQDSLAPFDAALARQTIEDEFGQPPEALFTSFDNAPISAASIAQVHLASVKEAAPAVAQPPENDAEDTQPATPTPEERPVAVKILRPGIEKAFERDLEFLYWLAEWALRAQPKLKRFKPMDVVQVFETTVRLEMDLRMEGAAASELAENFEGDTTYSVPAIDWQRSSRRVLTMSRVSGIPLDDRDALIAAGHDVQEVLTKAAGIFFNQVFRDGFFHGDQHPGNMFVDRDGNILAVDFGIMGRLDWRTRRHLADMLIATLQGDYHRLAQVYMEAGYLPQRHALDVFAQALRSVCEPIAGRPLNEISFARLLAQLLRLTESFELPVQPQLLLLQKNMLMAEGVSRSLDPSLNIWSLAQPLIDAWMRENRGPEARLRETVEDVLHTLRRLPAVADNLDRATQELAAGRIGLHPDTLQKISQRQASAFARWALLIAVAALILAATAAF
ncbi:2-polyprenylphenol 6-hydroxylase [Pelagibius litoralis]|uniref:2-polyprenylphenol 6-hydroxylase n=1 Tax=Pelagibius litoralis TaxID=374515 RepID=A0A967EV43_9PROT|nr:2-polyprenylphenol 6-hydroxylase [Pelagibius litoralis]NIA68121.1 2-polyprenylphenol 6-hydroxylase [Pelagibius litoralis]